MLILLLARSPRNVHAELIIDSKNCIPTRTTIECKIDVCTVDTYIFFQGEGYRCTDPKTYTLLENDGYYLDSKSIFFFTITTYFLLINEKLLLIN